MPKWCRNKDGSLEFREPDAPVGPLEPSKDADVQFAFAMYAIFDPATKQYNKANDGTVPTPLLRNVLRSVGMAPTTKQLDVYEEGCGGPEGKFTIDDVRKMVAELSAEPDEEDDIIQAYKVMAEDNPKDGMIDKDLLWQKMNRRLGNEDTTNKMIADGQPDGDGNIDYAAFVKRQFKFRKDAFEVTPPVKEPVVTDIQAKLASMYDGSKTGPAYPFEKLTNDDLAKLAGHSNETRRLLEWERNQQASVRERITNEVEEKVAEEKLEALKTEKSCPRALVILRELASLYTGHKWCQDLEDLEMACLVGIDDIKDDNERARAKELQPQLESFKAKIIKTWNTYPKAD